VDVGASCPPGAETTAVTAVEIESDTIGDAAFAEAIREEVLTWEMPGSTWNMELGFDLEFDPARDLYGVDVEIEE
jgi:hypothetical protein